MTLMVSSPAVCAAGVIGAAMAGEIKAPRMWRLRLRNKLRRHPEEAARIGERPSRRIATSTERAALPRFRGDAGAPSSASLLRMTLVFVVRPYSSPACAGDDDRQVITRS